MQEQVHSHGQDTLKKGQGGEVRHCLESKRCCRASVTADQKKSRNHMSHSNRKRFVWPGTSPRDWLAHSHELAKQSPAPTLQGSNACFHFLSLRAMESAVDCAQRMFPQRSQNVIIASAPRVANKVQSIRMKIPMLDRRTP